MGASIDTRTAALRTLRALLIRGLVDDGDAEEMVDLTRRAFDLVGLGFSRDYHWSGRHVVGGDLERWTAIYPEVGHDDPCGPFLESSPAGTLYVVDRQHENGDTDTYRAFCREEFADAVIIRFEGADGETLPAALYRDRVRGAFDEDELEELRALYPLFAGALQTRSALDAMTLDAGDGDARPLASLEVTYPDGGVSWNHRSRALFERELGALSSRGWGRLERALHRVVVRFSSGGGRRQRLLGRLSVEVAHVPSRAAEARRVLILFYREEMAHPGTNAPRTPAEELLSARQRTVARLAARGLTVRAMAERLDVGPETVREHLRTVFARLGVHSRTELTQLVD